MRRYYSHYTFIYPDTYLKNHVVELDDENRVVGFFPFEREIGHTEFYSGCLIFLHKGDFDEELINTIKHTVSTKFQLNPDIEFDVINIKEPNKNYGE